LDPDAFDAVTVFCCDQRLLTAEERGEILWLLGEDFPFTGAVRAADSVHVHVKVDDVLALPHPQIHDLGAAPENEAPGYIKYRFCGGINMIFSSIPVAADDLVEGAVMTPKPFMDHAGLDIRCEEPSHRAVFDAIPGQAAAGGWRTVAQSGPVRCCHTVVAGKHWVYPPASLTGWRRPIEIAFGALKVFDGSMGCDLRPMDPVHSLAGSSTRCCPGSATGERGATAALQQEP
jgi:hypothetical protein